MKKLSLALAMLIAGSAVAQTTPTPARMSHLWGVRLLPTTLALCSSGEICLYRDQADDHIRLHGVDNAVTDVSDVLQHRTWVNVKSFGAKGDGVTNDTAAIQAAVDSIRTVGGVVYFPAGRYMVASTIALNATGHAGWYDGVVLQGDGYASQIKASAPISVSGSLQGNVTFYGAAAYGLKHAGIRNLRISGYDETSTAGGTIGALVKFGNTDGTFVTDSWIDTHSNAGLYWNDPADSQNCTLRNNYATRIGGWAAGNAEPLAAYNPNCNGLTMVGNVAEQVGMAVEQTGSGGLIKDNRFSYTGYNNPLAGGTWYTAMSIGSTQTAAQLLITDNYVDHALYAINVTVNGGGLQIERNNIHTCAGPIVVASTSTGSCTVRSNYIEDALNANTGAIVHGAGGAGNGFLIENNVIVAGSTSPWAFAMILADSTAHDVVRGNRIVGAAVVSTAIFYEYTGVNSAITFINNTIEGPAAGIPRLKNWRGRDILGSDIPGLDNGAVISTLQASRFRISAPPTVGTWSVGDIGDNTTPSAGGSGVLLWTCTTGGTPGTWTAQTLN